MKTQSRIGVAVGGVSVIFSTLCFLITAVFTPALVLAVLFGASSGAIGMALKARRTAVVAFAFALTPLCRFLILHYVVEPAGTGYVTFIPLGAALIVAAWKFADYSGSRRAEADSVR